MLCLHSITCHRTHGLEELTPPTGARRPGFTSPFLLTSALPGEGLTPNPNIPTDYMPKANFAANIAGWRHGGDTWSLHLGPP